jgi:ERF superfamily
VSETDAALNAALAAAQAEFPAIPREKTVTVRTREQGTYSFSYATLDAILAATRPALNKQGLALVQLLEHHDGLPAVRTELRHKDGGVLGSSFPLPSVPSTPQQLGSLLTYLRRYTIIALLGVAAEEDDDAAQAAEPAQPKAKKRKPKPEPEPEPRPEPARPEVEPAGPARLANISKLLLELANLDDQLGYERTNWNDWAKDYAGVQSATDLDAQGADRLIAGLERMRDRRFGELARQAEAERDLDEP